MRKRIAVITLLFFLGFSSVMSAEAQWRFLAHTRDIFSIKPEGNDLWMGTGGGLVRMDRSSGRLAEADPGPVETDIFEGRMGASIKRIEADGSGRHLVLAARWIWKVEGTTWSNTGKFATSLAKASDGTVIACGQDSLHVFRNGSWGGTSLGVDERYGTVSKSHLAVSPAGRLWSYTQWGGWDVIVGSMLIEYDINAGRILRSFGGPGAGTNGAWKHIPSLNYLNAIVFDSAGALWGGGSGLYRMADTGMVRMHPERISDIHALQAGRTGSLWAAGSEGLYHISGPAGIKEYSVSEMGFASDARIQALSMDAEGVLWVGTHLGLASLSGQTWKTWPTSTVPLPSNAITALAAGPDGSMWIGSGSSLVRYRDSAWMVPVQAIPDGNGPSLSSLAVQADGVVWGAAGDRGIFRFKPDGDKPAGEWTWLDSALGPRYTRIQDIVIGPKGVVWAVGDYGLVRIEGDDVLGIPNRVGGLPSGRKSLAVDGSGRVWVGTPLSLLSFDGSQWREELSTGLMDLVFDKAGRLWGQGDSAFHWMEAGVWRKHSFPLNHKNQVKTVHALVQGPEGSIIFHNQLCFMSCSPFPYMLPRVSIGILTPDTLRYLELGTPGGPPTAIAYDDQGALWLGSQSGLAISSQKDVLSIRKRPAKGRGQAQGRARLILPVRGYAGAEAEGNLFDFRGRRGKAGSGLRAEIPAATDP